MKLALFIQHLDSVATKRKVTFRFRFCFFLIFVQVTVTAGVRKYVTVFDMHDVYSVNSVSSVPHS